MIMFFLFFCTTFVFLFLQMTSFSETDDIFIYVCIIINIRVNKKTKRAVTRVFLHTASLYRRSFSIKRDKNSYKNKKADHQEDI